MPTITKAQCTGVHSPTGSSTAGYHHLCWIARTDWRRRHWIGATNQVTMRRPCKRNAGLPTDVPLNDPIAPLSLDREMDFVECRVRRIPGMARRTAVRVVSAPSNSHDHFMSLDPECICSASGPAGKRIDSTYDGEAAPRTTPLFSSGRPTDGLQSSFGGTW